MKRAHERESESGLDKRGYAHEVRWATSRLGVVFASSCRFQWAGNGTDPKSLTIRDMKFTCWGGTSGETHSWNTYFAARIKDDYARVGISW